MSVRWADAKDPADSSWWEYDTTAQLNGATLASASWTVPAGLTKVGEMTVGNLARVRLAGGTAGTLYTLTLDFVSSTTEVFQRSAVLKVREQ